MSALPELPDHLDEQPGADPAPSTTPPALIEERDLQAVPDAAGPIIDSDLDSEPGTGGVGGLVEQARAAFTPPSPPSFWNERQPAPAEEFERARKGTHLPPAGPIRTIAIVDGALAAGAQTVLAALSWAIRHPARRAVVGVGMLLLLLSPVGSIAAWVLFGIPHLLFQIFG